MLCMLCYPTRPGLNGVWRCLAPAPSCLLQLLAISLACITAYIASFACAASQASSPFCFALQAYACLAKGARQAVVPCLRAAAVLSNSPVTPWALPCFSSHPSVLNHSIAIAVCRLMGGQHYPPPVRRMAVEAWVAAGKPAEGNMAEAVRRFREMLPPKDQPKNCSEFVRTWVRSWQQRSTVRSPSPPPRKSLIDDDTARQCVKQLLAGYWKNRQHKRYRSIRDAVERNSYLREVLHTRQAVPGHDLSLCTLWRRMKAVDPSLTRRMLRFTRKLSPATKRERVQYCQHLLAMQAAHRRQYLARVVWIDSKKLYIVPEGRLVYAPKDADLTVEDKRMPQSSSQVKKIVYYAAVNAAIGPVYWKQVTGTTRYKTMKGYRAYFVSAAACLSASKSYEPVPRWNQQWGFSFTAFTAHCIRLPHCLSSA